MTKTATKLVAATTLPTGVTFDSTRGLYRARAPKTSIHLGYFKDKRLAAKAVTATGVSVDNSKTTNKFRVRVEGNHIGYFKTRTAAVKALLKVL